jgi:hypothetical protein
MELCGTRQRQVMHSTQGDDLCLLGMVVVYLSASDDFWPIPGVKVSGRPALSRRRGLA